MLKADELQVLLAGVSDREVAKRLAEHYAILGQAMRLAKVLLDGAGPLGSRRAEQYSKFEAILDVAGEYVREDVLPDE